MTTTEPTGPDGHWCAAEDAALHELPHAVQLLYLRGLRRWVGKDGVVGRARRLSERALIELLTVPPRRGRRADFVVTPTRQSVRSALAVLVEVGLIVPLHRLDESLVFRLPYALQGQSVRRMRNPMSNQPTTPTKPHGNAGLRGGGEGMSNPMSNPHQSKASTTTVTASCEVTKARASESPRVGETGGEALPPGIDPDLWALFVGHHREQRKWSISRQMLAMRQLGEIVDRDGVAKANATLEWAASRGLADLRDAHQRRRDDQVQAEAKSGNARRDGESLANRSVRELRDGFGKAEEGGTLIPFPGTRHAP